jgi:predicted transcriptional regulator
MEPDYLLSDSRWEILSLIAENPLSPIQIAKKLNTTVSYVSQQLRLLEAAGLTEKKRTGNVEKGKPRTLFFIPKEITYLITLTKDFALKKLIYLTDYHKIILRIWSLENNSLHYIVEKFFWLIEKYLEDIQGIFINTKTISPKIIIVSDKKIKQKIDSKIKQLDEKINYDLIPIADFLKLNQDDIFPIYYHSHLFRKIKDLKGGKNTNAQDN